MPEIHEFGVFSLIQRGEHGLQRHAAFGAVPGVVLLHLRVHGAGVDGAGLSGFWLSRNLVGTGRRDSVLVRVLNKLRLALGATEVVVPPLMLRRVMRLFRHVHTADWIFQFRHGRRCIPVDPLMMLMAMVGVIVRFRVGHEWPPCKCVVCLQDYFLLESPS